VLAEPAPPGARVVARDWPGAPWVAVPCLAAGVPLLAWSVVAGHAIEGGGAVVFCGFGALAAWLALARRRDVVVAASADGVTVRGREGAGPFARPVDLVLPPGTCVEVVPFAVPEGAPDVPDRGGDLVLTGGGARVPLARRTGPGWREELDRAAAVLRLALGNRDGVAAVP
jgi:hypothetical protein